jgi:hypothetical protein
MPPAHSSPRGPGAQHFETLQREGTRLRRDLGFLLLTVASEPNEFPAWSFTSVRAGQRAADLPENGEGALRSAKLEQGSAWASPTDLWRSRSVVKWDCMAASLRERTAIHEAAHVCAARIPILSVTIDHAPHMHRGAYKAAHACGLEYLTVLCLAGIAAEELFCGPITDASDQGDLKMAREYLARHFDPLQAAAELSRCRAAAERLVRSAWAQQRIRLLAEALLRCGTLSCEDIHRI